MNAFFTRQAQRGIERADFATNQERRIESTIDDHLTELGTVIPRKQPLA